MNRKKTTSKESTAMLFRRYLWLVETLNRTQGATLKEIKTAWLNNSLLNPYGEELAERTFYNHRKDIERMFDINIICNRSEGYRYQIEDELPDERNSMRKWMLNNFTLNTLLNENRDLHQHILLEDVPSGHNYLIPIINAIRNRQPVAITYRGYWKPEPQTLTAEPYCLKLFRQRWYLLALKREKGELRIYPLDRIEQLDTLNDSYTIPDEFDAEAYFSNFMGVLTDHEEDVQTVQIRVYNEQSNYLKSLPLHHSQKIIKESDRYVDFEYYITPTHDFWQALLMYGHELEVLKPVWLRDEFLYIAGEMTKLYKKR